MNQANVSKLVNQLKFKIPDKKRKLKQPKGPEGRMDRLRKTVTALVKYERLELNFNRADESRQYAERLISEAIRYGDCHTPTMELADYWLLEKQLVHKLFKVLVPRFQNFEVSCTRMYKAPRPCPGNRFHKAVLELRGNPYPDIKQNTNNNRNFIHNVLLDAAKYDFRQQKYAEIAKNIALKESDSVEESNHSEEAEPTEEQPGKVETPKTS